MPWRHAERLLSSQCGVDGERGAHGIAIDGKAQRGGCALPLRAVPFTPSAPSATTRGSSSPTNRSRGAPRDKAEAELTVTPALLARIDWCGRVLTGDALFYQRALCTQVRAAGGDYLLLVKANQGTLHGISSCASIPRRQSPPRR